jgi:hypothetical protein
MKRSSSSYASEALLRIASAGTPGLASGMLARTDLLPYHLSQRLIDPVLPARFGFLKWHQGQAAAR